MLIVGRVGRPVCWYKEPAVHGEMRGDNHLIANMQQSQPHQPTAAAASTADIADRIRSSPHKPTPQYDGKLVQTDRSFPPVLLDELEFPVTGLKALKEVQIGPASSNQ